MVMDGFDLISLVPLILISLPLAYGGWWIAPKMGANRVLWMILFLIPGVNYFAVIILLFKIAGTVLDKLNALTKSN